MRRREFIAIASGAVASWPLHTHAQPGEPLRRIGVFNALGADDSETETRLAAFRQELERLG